MAAIARPDAELRFIGTGGPFGNGGRLQSCILVTAGSYRFLIDCGATSLAGLGRSGVDSDSIDAILISHLHGDHFGGLPFLLAAAFFGSEELGGTRPRVRPLTIAGPAGTERRLHEALAVFGYESVDRRWREGRFGFPLRFVTLEHRITSAIDVLGVTALPVVHVPWTHPTALRIQLAGLTIGYSGDTEWTETLLEVARGADVFISQAYSFERETAGFMSYRAIAAQAHRLDCREIVLTHVGPEMDARLDEASLRIAHDGMVLELRAGGA